MIDNRNPSIPKAYTKQSSVLRDESPTMNHGNKVLPTILEPSKHGYINPRCTSRPSA